MSKYYIAVYFDDLELLPKLMECLEGMRDKMDIDYDGEPTEAPDDDCAHEWESISDAENGTEDIWCKLCGESRHHQF